MDAMNADAFRSTLAAFPPDSFLRVFHAERALDEQETEVVLARMAAFLGSWAAHEHPVHGAFALLERRFLIVAADESKTALSGCSMDALVGSVRATGAAIDVELVHAPPICFRDGNDVRCVDRAAFRELVESGAVTGDTPAFDLTIDRVAAYLAGELEKPARATWHARAFKKLALA